MLYVLFFLASCGGDVIYECTCTSDVDDLAECTPEYGWSGAEDPGADGEPVELALEECCDADDDSCACTCEEIDASESENF